MIYIKYAKRTEVCLRRSFVGKVEVAPEKLPKKARRSSSRNLSRPAVNLFCDSAGKPIYTSKKKKGGDMFPFYSEETEGLQLGPKTVVVLGLAFMGIVVLLHIISKIRS